MPRLAVLVLLLVPVAAATAASVTPGHRAVVLGTDGAPYGFVEFVPTAFASDPATRLPLVVMCHGSGECGPGTDAAEVWMKCTTHGPSREIRLGRPWFEAAQVVALSPQCPVGQPSSWEVARLDAFITWAVARYRIDPDRIAITGCSLGGGGALAYAVQHGDRLAACVPCATYQVVGTGVRVAGVATWLFHTWDDPVCVLFPTGTYPSGRCSIWWADEIAARVRGVATHTTVIASYPNGGSATVAASATMTASYTVAGGWRWTQGIDASASSQPKLTIFPSGGHTGWPIAYDTQALWSWVFAQRRSGTTAPGGGTTSNGGTTSGGTTSNGATTGSGGTGGTTGTGTGSATGGGPVTTTGTATASSSKGHGGCGRGVGASTLIASGLLFGRLKRGAPRG